MTLIKKRCENLLSRIEQLRDLESLHSQAQRLEERRYELDRHRNELKITLKCIKVLIRNEHIKPHQCPNPIEARDLLIKVQKKFQDDPSQITKGKDYTKLLDALLVHTNSLNELANNVWTEIRIQSDPTEDRLLDSIAQIPGQSKAIKHIRLLRSKLSELGKTPPVSDEEYNAFMAVAVKLAQAWNALEFEDLPDAVRRFFKAAQSISGAPLNLWTDEVKTWLETHDMLNGIRLHFRGGS